jgi:signal transduction histidine kinase
VALKYSKYIDALRLELVEKNTELDKVSSQLKVFIDLEKSRDLVVSQKTLNLENENQELHDEIDARKKYQDQNMKHLETLIENEKSLVENNNEYERSNRELDQFTSLVSHDLRSPLRAILHLTKWIVDDKENTLSSESTENLRLLKTRVKRVDNLLVSLLEYSKIGKDHLKKEEICCETLVKNIFETLYKSKKIDLNCSELPKIYTHKVPLQTVFRNLISNSIKHNDKELGLINISCETSIENDVYTFSISDNGPGVPESHKSSIFDMFITLKPRDVVEGSGMGLSFVKKTVELEGGRVWLEESSTNSEGACFKFTWLK